MTTRVISNSINPFGRLDAHLLIPFRQQLFPYMLRNGFIVMMSMGQGRPSQRQQASDGQLHDGREQSSTCTSTINPENDPASKEKSDDLNISKAVERKVKGGVW